MAISVSTRWQDGVATVRLGGELDLATCGVVAQEIDRAITAPDIQLVRIDLSEMEFIDSSGVSVLLKGRRAADRIEVAYGITGATGSARRATI